MLENSDAGFLNVYQWNVENSEWGENGAICGSANDYGKYTEGAVVGMLWDIFDDSNDDFDGDGIEDSLHLGIEPILDVLLNRYVDGHHPDNIDEFWEAWWSNQQPGHGQGDGGYPVRARRRGHLLPRTWRC
ncbi:MAG: hypothetical protein DRP47_01665 [Candidatus Zixiibacteriota bacterium]|nr:MAG: hypothetical protein DRP47_01665 [candidate division Zixibacteria bacterium]